MQFDDDLAGGVVLIRPALQSPNYVAGASGWAIKIDGSAEFANIVLRGDGTGYTVIVGPEGLPQVKIGSNVSQGFIQFPTNRAIEDHVSTILSAVGNFGLPNEWATLQIQGPSLDAVTDRFSLLLTSANNDGSSAPSFTVSGNGGAFAPLVVRRDNILVREPTFTVWPTASADTCLFVTSAQGHTGSLMALQDFGQERHRFTVEGRYTMQVAPSAQSAFLLNTNAGYTGPLVRVQNNSVDALTVFPSGNVQVGGSVTAAGPVFGSNFRNGTIQTAAPGTTPGQTGTTLTFGTPMSGTPRVTLTPNSAAANLNTSNIRWAVNNVSTTGFSVQCWRDTNNATNFDWIAAS